MGESHVTDSQEQGYAEQDQDSFYHRSGNFSVYADINLQEYSPHISISSG